MTDILYSFRRCPYAIRARMILAVSGHDPEIREVVLRDKPPEMLAISPKATVPVLQLSEGTVLDESLDIMNWALGLSDPEEWLKARKDPALETLLERCDGPFKDALDRYKYSSRHPEGTGVSAREETRPFLFALEDHLSPERPFLAGVRPGFHDLAIFPFIRQFAGVDLPWFQGAGYPRLELWRQSLSESPLFTTVMKKLPPWKASDPPLSFRESLRA